MIIARNIKKSYGNLEVLKGVDLQINKGELVSIIGSSGAGKTTLLQILGTLDQASTGNLSINNQEISGFSRKELSKFRNHNIGFVFQFHHLLPEFTALENIMLPGLIGKKNKKELEKRAVELLNLLNIGNRGHHKPNELSGGEQQRVAVARALINNPAIILADEPSGNLDTENANELHQLFQRLKSEFDQTFVIVTHNKNLAELSDRVIEIKDGIII